MDFRIIPESLPDDVKTEYLLRDMPINEVVQIVREALSRVDYGTRNTYKIELWVRNEYDKQGNIDYLRHIINRGKLWYSDILKAFKLYNPFFESDPSRPIDWLDTMMREKKKEEVFLTDDFEYVPKSSKPVRISNPRWEHKDDEKAENTPGIAENNDCILLKADLENYTANAPVKFDIYDTSLLPPKRIASVNGKNIRNVGTGEWVVSFKHDPLPELEFDASASCKTTPRCPIAIKHNEGRILVVLNEAGTKVLPYYEFLLYEGTECRLYAESDSNGEYVLPDNIGDTFDVQVIGPGKHHPLWNQSDVFDGELPPDEVVPVEQCIDEDEDTLSGD